ncbi:MAG: hypothetical protein IT181_14985 [Acidobacteria bacterium]|nr:hypothetical protein [Acidobacteriota bacterium]
MSPVLLQDVIVALTALAAAWVVARRVIGFAATERSPKCASCESGACAPASTSAGSVGRPAEHPLVFVRSPQR